nr:MAG: maturation protein [Sanya steitz-like virus 1]UUW21120.1 MAG: maturation protein [Sanya steitz-like virus 1]
MPRTRTRIRPITGTYHVSSTRRNNATGRVTYNSSKSVNYSTSETSSVITDEGGSRPKDNAVRDVTHTKITIIPRPIPDLTWIGNSGVDTYTVKCGGFCDLRYVPTGRYVPAASTEWINQSFKKFSEHIPRQVSVVNFLLELDDFPSMVTSLLNLKSRLGNRLKKVGDLNGWRKELGSDYLWYNFGLRPMIEDIRKMLSTVENVRKRIRYLQKTHGKPTRVRSRMTTQLPIDIGNWGQWEHQYPLMWSPYIIPQMRTRGIYFPARVEHVVGATMIQSLSGLDSIEGFMSAMLSSLGFNRPLSIAWEAIPFSWLVDYFVNVGAMVDDLKSSEAFAGEISLYNGWTSSRVEFNTLVEAQFGPSYQFTGGGEYPLVVTSVVTYKRSKGIQTTQGLQLKNPTKLSLAQYLNIAAVL